MPTITEVALLIAAGTGLGTLVNTILVGRRLGKVDAKVDTAVAKVEQVSETVDVVKKATDGMHSELMRVSGDAREAEGKLAGKETEKAAEADRKAAVVEAVEAKKP